MGGFGPLLPRRSGADFLHQSLQTIYLQARVLAIWRNASLGMFERCGQLVPSVWLPLSGASEASAQGRHRFQPRSPQSERKSFAGLLNRGVVGKVFVDVVTVGLPALRAETILT